MCPAAKPPYSELMPADRSPHRGTTVLAIGLAAVALAGSAATIALAIANRRHLANLDAADPIAIVVPLGFAAVGGLIAARRPQNPIGWLFLAIAIVSGLQGVGDQYVRYAELTHPGSLPGAEWVLWATNVSTPLLFPTGAVGMTILLLPDGHMPSRRWRPLAALMLFVAVWLSVGSGIASGRLSGASNGSNYPLPRNPLGVAALNVVNPAAGAAAWTNAFWSVASALLIVAAAAPFVRMRRSRGEERQQLKWIAYAVLISAVLVLPVTFLAGTVIASWVFDAAVVLGFGVALPVAAGVAILKYRLYDIDIVISRTLVYGSLAVFITAVYVGIAVGIGALIGGGGRPNLLLSIVATAIVAVGFQPVRERMQRVANRLVYGKRATPYEVLSQFSERVAESYAVDDVMPRMARVLAEGTGAQRADIWLRSGTIWREAAVWPIDSARAQPVPANNGSLPPVDATSRMVEVRHQGDLLGALGVTKRSGETLTPVEENLLTHLARQAGLVLRNVGLTSDLQARLEELRASRQRLVTAQDEERRRLERNLHDGAQQHLVALKVKLGLVEMLIRSDPVRAKQTLDQLKGDADEALETLRDLARGIYPPLLADKGLRVALESQARKTMVPVTVEAGDLGRYPQEVEAAVYFCVLEALQNIQKYARASRVVIRMSEADGVIRFEVDDNGQGFDVAGVKRGAGLANMEDRIDALGGMLHVSSSPGHGTTVVGSLACAQAVIAL
jgi:signal transduction histidine kinase